jgi:V/A-type H+-transporting ATPase subunit E
VEVLKTSDELERQILEDARKKASRILENTDKECAQIRSEWEAKFREDAGRMDVENARRIAAQEQELAAAMPLDQMRERLSFMEKRLLEELKGCFKAMTAKEIAEVFSVLIRRVSSIFSGKRITVYAGGIGEAEAKRMLADCIPSAAIIGIKPITDIASPLQDPRGLILETEDKKIRYRGTFDELTRILLEEHRDTLVESLFGKDI